MKVIVSTPNWIISGVNSFNLSLLRGIQAAGHTVELLIIPQDTPGASNLPIPTDIPVRYLEFDGGDSWWTARWTALERYLNAAGPCVYLPGYDFQNASIVPALGNDVIVVGVVHSDEDYHYEHLLRMGRYWNWVVTVSRHLQARALDIEPAVTDRCSQISYGVRHPPTLPARAARARLRIVYCGRFVEAQKRVSDLPIIALAVDQAGIDVEWLLIGDGPAEASLRSGFGPLIERGVVTFAGRLSNDDTLRSYADCDVLILTSEYEGLPVAMLEGMAHGLIPLVTQIESGVDDVIRHGRNGFKVPVGYIDGFVAAIRHLHEAPEDRVALREAAFETLVNGRYAIEHVVGQYIDIFERARLAVDEGRFRRPKTYRPGSWTGDYIVPPELQIAPDAYYNLKWLSDWQRDRIEALETQLRGLPVRSAADIVERIRVSWARRVWRFAWRTVVQPLFRMLRRLETRL